MAPLISRAPRQQARLDLSSSELAKLTGREFFLRSERHWIKPALQLGDPSVVTMEGDNRAHLAIAPSALRAAWVLAKEQGRWKVCLSRAYEEWGERFKGTIKPGRTEEEYIFGMLEQSRKKEIDPRILDGPLD